jgi:hypothetical protein
MTKDTGSTDAGFNSTLSALLVAEANQATISVEVDTTQIWAGNAAPYCLVYMIEH